MTETSFKNEQQPPIVTAADTHTGSNRSLLLYTAIALFAAFFIRFFIAAPYVVSGASMEPTFDNWNYLIVDRVSYGLCVSNVPLIHLGIPCIPIGDPQRGDVVVFNMPGDPGRALIKRIIGLPGETVILSGEAPTVTIINADHPDGFTLSEPYLDPANLGGASNMRVTLNADQYFVLGDNRRVSADSRLWGLLPREDIVGRVLIRLYPLENAGLFPGIERYANQ